MSAAVCGSKRSFFDDQSPPLAQRLPPSPVLTKRQRRSSSTSPIRFAAPYLLEQLRSLFPHMDPQVLERALEECGNDMDAAIKRLHELCLGSAEETSASAEQTADIVANGLLCNDEAAATTENPSVPNNLPADGAEWVELFVREMMSASSVDDARARAAKVLEVLEKSISERAGAEAAQSFQKASIFFSILFLVLENMMLKQQIEGLVRENTILKRAVAIQHERQKEFEERNQELQHLKQLVSQYQEQCRTLEINNYALTIRLKQAEQSNSIPGRFHPDIF
ncbi:hypothetical protein ACFX13_025804 [Malus domestica]|uniref:CUE domain-containing protein n=1 Tax=Malus domestica TaxID=3750 RepID=A0A498HHF6_MALDO|nr:hypothetical protein DVH24_031258 [Malus domestica]